MILLINHECIAIANTINHQVSMKKTIDQKIKQQMAKNVMDQLRNQNEKGTKAIVLRSKGYAHTLLTKWAKDLKHARQDLETRMHQCHHHHDKNNNNKEHDHIIKHSSVHYKTNLDCHKNMNHPRKAELTLIQIHEAIMTHYNFVNNPYLNDMLNMKEIKYDPNVPMSKDDIKLHRDQATLFLEKSTWGVLGKAVKNVAGKVMKKINSDDVENINSVMGEGVGIVMETVDDNEEEARVATSDDDESDVDKAELQHLSFFDVLTAIIFGLANGFFAGMIEDFRQDFSDKSCNFEKIKKTFEDAVGKSSALWTVIRSAWQNVWGKEGRAEIVEAIELAFKAYKDVFVEIFNWIYKCKGTRTIAIMMGIVGIALAVNAALMAVGGAAIPIILKLGALILELITSAKYVKGLVLNFVKALKQVKEGKCHKICKKNLIQYMSEVVGFLVQIVVMSGIGDVMGFARPKGAKIGKISWNPEFIHDLKLLAKTGRMLGKSVGKIKNPFKGNKIDMYADAMKSTDNVADDIAKNVDDVGKSADDVPQRAESGDEIGAVVEESGMKEEMKNFDTKKKSDHYEGHNVLDPRL